MKRRAYCESHFMRFVFWQRCSSAAVRRSSTEVFRHSSAARRMHNWPLCSSELSWRTWNCKPAGFYCIIPLCVSTASSHHPTNATTPANREPAIRESTTTTPKKKKGSENPDLEIRQRWLMMDMSMTTPPQQRTQYDRRVVGPFLMHLWSGGFWPPVPAATLGKKCTFLQNGFILNKRTSGLSYSALL